GRTLPRRVPRVGFFGLFRRDVRSPAVGRRFGRRTAEERHHGGEVLVPVIVRGRHDQAAARSSPSRAAMGAASSSSRPSLILILFSISSATSAFSLRNRRAFSLP